MGKIKKSKHRNKASKTTPADKFNEALKRLARFQDQNRRFAEEIDALVARVTPKIEQCEVEKFSAYKDLATTLIPFFSKKTLPEYLREELHDWINESLFIANNHPFSHKIDLSDADSLLEEHITQHFDNKNEKLLKKLKKEGAPEEELEAAAEMFDRFKNASPEELDVMRDALFEEIFGSAAEDLEESLNATEDMFGDNESFFDSDFNEHDIPFGDDMFEESVNEGISPEGDILQNLINETSVNKLFRRIARQIHPDLEQDDASKQAKNQQMGRLIQAREEKDIATILNMHIEVFGAAPTDLPESDFPKLTKLINFQIEKVKAEKYELLQEKPFNSVFYDWFYAKTPKAEARRVQDFITESKEETKALRRVAKDITSITTLRNYLENRYHASRFNMPDFSEFDDFRG